MKKIEISEELERIRAKDKNGILYPHAVVAASKARESVLHELFDWDNRTAANNWRLQQARQVIARYHVTITNATTSRVRGYVSLKTDRKEGGGYRAIGEVVSDEQLREELLQDALDEMQSMEARYVRLRELKPLFKVANELREKYGVKPEESASV